MNTQNFNNNIGIDTLKLYIEGKLKNSAINNGTIKYFEYKNSPELNSQFQNTEQGIIECAGFRHKENKKFQVNFHNGNCTIQCSVPKINNKPYELGSVKENKFAYEFLTDTLSEFYEYKEADLKNSRIDLTRNIELNNPMQAYNTILSAIPNKYKGYNFMNTHTSFNGSIAHCIYDKPQEILDKKEAIPEYWNNKNIARNEIRLLKGSKLKQLSNTIKLNLLEPKVYLQQESFNKLQNYYIEYNKQFFKYASEQINFTKIEHINQVLEAKQKNIPLTHCLQRLGLTFLSLEEAAKIYYESKQSRHQFKKTFMNNERKYYTKPIQLDFSVSKSLLEELKHKTLMRVA